jgi:hypothetical protein
LGARGSAADGGACGACGRCVRGMRVRVGAGAVYTAPLIVSRDSCGQFSDPSTW